MDRDDAASVSQPTRGAVTSSSLSTSSLSSASPPPASASASPTAPTTTPIAATAAPLARSVSQTSAASSTRSHRSIRRGGGGGSRRTSSRVPTRSSSQNPQPHAGSSSASVTSEDNKSLTSFPSFSPKAPSTASPPLLPTPQRPRLAGPTASTASLVDSLLADDGRALLPVTGPSTSTASTSSVAAAVPPAASSSSSAAARSALFDDSDAPAINYGDLHLADDAHIARLVGKHGAIALVRQLAEDLARRDTQVAALRARAADRERFLRKIILECGLSSLDLATRLRALEQEQEARLAAAAANTSIPASHARRVSDLLGDAMSDDHSPRQVSSDYYYNDATIRAASAALASSSSTLKTKSNGNNKAATSAGTTKGWKDYLWGGTTKKAGSGSGGGGAQTPPTQPSTQRGTATIRVTSSGERRPTIRDDLFQPPTAPTDAAAPTDATTDDSTRPTRSTSRASSVASAATSQSGRKPSLASLALRLVGGGSDTPQDSGDSTSASAAASLRNASGAANRRPGPPSTTLGRSTRASTLQSGNNNNSNNNGGSVGSKSLMAMRRSTSSAVLNGAGAVAALNGSAAPQAIPSRGVGGAGAGRNKTTGNGHKHQGSGGGGGGGGSGAANERWGGEMMDASPSSDGAAMRRTTYFPVEMDTILPLDVQPPTLTHMYNRYNSSGHLIDRFGFIYDQRRKKRQREAAQVAQVARHAKRGSRHSEMLDTAGGRVSRNGRPSPPHVGGGDDDDAVDTAVRVPDDDQASTGDASSLKNDSINDHDADSTHRPPSMNLASTPGPDKDSQTSAAPGGGPKRWQDYLKIATFPTELLSHTPAMNDTRIEVITEDGSSTLSGDVSGDAAGPKSPGFITSDGRGFVPPSTGAMAAATTSATTTSTTAGAAAVGLDTDSIASSTNTADTAADQKKLTKRRPALSSQAEPPTPAKEDVEPVRLLLQQLSDLHDTLQKERTVRWNEFLRKVRAERRREGEMMALAAAENIHSGSSSNGGGGGAKATMAMARTSMPETRLADGEIVGVAGLGNKGKLGRAKWNEFRALVLGGIPVLLRAKVWSECTGATSLRVPGAYDDLVAGRDPAADAEDPDVVAQIQADIHRTLTDNIFFREGPGTAKLNEVLLAYARRNPDVGYCQGMNLIAANLLLVTPSAEDAFWLLASIVETILPVGYYDHSLAASRADQQVLRAYVADVLPRLSARFDALSIDLETMTFQWFLSVFTDCLSAEVLFRVWDVVFCLNDGSVFLFQVALALLKLNEAALLRCETPAEIYTYINHQMTNHAISIDGLVQASEALRKLVRREDVEARRAVAMDAERALVAARAAAVAEAKAMRQQKLAARDTAAAAATETAVTTPADAGSTN